MAGIDSEPIVLHCSWHLCKNDGGRSYATDSSSETLLIEKDRRGVRGAKFVACTNFGRKGAQGQLLVRRTRMIDVCTETHTIKRVLENSPNEKTQTFHEHRLFLPRWITKEGAPT